MAIGERIRNYRKSIDISGKDFAKIIGISAGSLSDIENEKTNPSSDTLSSMVRNTEINPTWLLTGEGPMHKEPMAVSTKIQKIMEYEEQMPEETEHALDEAIRRLQDKKQVSDLLKQVEKLKAG
jgi:transcriptional regulator with XRE-family HTH domain